MGENIKISFVIPCYNAEKYICDCLESVYNQNIKEEFFEVICVNDCSTDDTQKVIEEWQKRHKNLYLINHSVNKRQSATRNTGLREARGKYIWFVDSDDTIKENCLGAILKTLEDNNLDLLLFNPTADKTRIYCQETPINGIEYMEKWLQTGQLSDTMYSVVYRLMKREVIVHNNCFLREDITMVEDVPFSYKICCYSQRVMAVYDNFYWVRPTDGRMSVTRSSLTAEKVFSAVFLNPQAVLEVADYAKNHSLFVADCLRKDASWWLGRLLNVNSLFAKMSVKQQIKFINLCREKVSLINEITAKADVSTEKIYTPRRLYFVIISSFIKRNLRKILRK